jgi:hypothetical protein
MGVKFSFGTTIHRCVFSLCYMWHSTTYLVFRTMNIFFSLCSVLNANFSQAIQISVELSEESGMLSFLIFILVHQSS